MFKISLSNKLKRGNNQFVQAQEKTDKDQEDEKESEPKKVVKQSNITTFSGGGFVIKNTNVKADHL
jgi:hypothetical protein